MADRPEKLSKGTIPQNFDLFRGPPLHINRVEDALAEYMKTVQDMRTAKYKVLSFLLEMCPKRWTVHPDLRVYIEDQAMLWSLAVTDIRPMFKRLRTYEEIVQNAKTTLDEFKKRHTEVKVMEAEFQLMKSCSGSTKTQLMQIQYMIRESYRALKAIRKSVEKTLLEFREAQTEIGKDLILMFEEIQKDTCSEGIQVIELIEGRLNSVPQKKRNRNGQSIDDLEFVQKIVQCEVDKIKKTPVDLSARIQLYNSHNDAKSFLSSKFSASKIKDYTSRISGPLVPGNYEPNIAKDRVSRISRVKSPAPENKHDKQSARGYESASSSVSGAIPDDISDIKVPFATPKNATPSGQGKITKPSSKKNPTKNVGSSQSVYKTPKSTKVDPGRGTGSEGRSSRATTPVSQDTSRPSSRCGRESRKSSRPTTPLSQTSQSENKQSARTYFNAVESDRSCDDFFKVKAKIDKRRCKRSRQPFANLAFPASSVDDVAEDFYDCR